MSIVVLIAVSSTLLALSTAVRVVSQPRPNPAQEMECTIVPRPQICQRVREPFQRRAPSAESESWCKSVPSALSKPCWD